MNYSIKQKFNTFLLSTAYILLLFIYMPVECIYHYYPSLWSLIGRLSALFSYLIPLAALIMMIQKRNIKRKLNYSIILGLYILILSFSTLINGESMKYVMDYSLKLISYTLIQYVFLSRNPKLYLNVTLKVLWVYIVINFITVIQYPDGMYRGVMSDGSMNNWNWFLGYKNSFLPYYYLSAVLGCAGSIITKSKKLAVANIAMAILMEISLIRVDAVTSYIGILLVYAVYFAIGLIAKLRINFTLVSGVVNSLVFTLLVVMNRVAPMIAYFVSYYLQRDITFSHRRDIWNRAVESIQNNLLVGHGYQRGSDVVSVLGMQHPHNMYLWQLYRGGIILGGAFVFLLGYSLHKAEKYENARLGKFFVLALTIMMIMWQFEVFGDSILIFGIIYLTFSADKLGKIKQEGHLK